MPAFTFFAFGRENKMNVLALEVTFSTDQEAINLACEIVNGYDIEVRRDRGGFQLGRYLPQCSSSRNLFS
jgi:hypothetical protein